MLAMMFDNGDGSPTTWAASASDGFAKGRHQIKSRFPSSFPEIEQWKYLDIAGFGDLDDNYPRHTGSRAQPCCRPFKY
jgi:hypothetical protein